MGVATAVFLAGLLITVTIMPADDATRIFSYAAVGAGLSLGGSLAIEASGGLRSLLRADIVMLIALFGLTFVEFLVPSRDIFGLVVSPEGAYNTCLAMMLGFIGIVLGRHFFATRHPPRRSFAAMDLSGDTMFRLFLLVFILGYLHIFLAVKFDIFEALRQMALPRFSQSWGRGRLGGWADLLVEVGALIYLIPPLTGMIYAQAKRYNLVQKTVVTAIFIFTLYFGFASGTRNVFGVYMITFAGAYLALKSRITIKQMVAFIAPVMTVSLIGMYFMLEFRNVGLDRYSFSEAEFNGVFVDSNMAVIASITDAFPRVYDYLGLEIPYIALIRPIPRAIWPGKPEGLSVPIEEVIAADGTSVSIACTYVGETYMSGGMLGVFAYSLLFGILASKWNQLGQDLSSNFKLILYVSGFFCAAILMRSLLSAVPTILPSLGLWMYGKIFLARTGRHR